MELPAEILFRISQIKDRSVNYTTAEVNRLQSLIAKYQNILFWKKTDGNSTKQKDNVWELIKCEFNALGETPRTAKQLKYKFENMKKAAKKVARTERQEMRCTDADDVIRQKLPPIPANQIETKIHIIDVDETKDFHGENKILTANESILTEDNNGTTEILEFDTSTPYSSFKRPITSPLIRRIKKQKVSDNCNFIQQKMQEKNISKMESLQELELQKIRDSIRHAQQLHDQELRHKEERHSLEIKKLNLEIAILKKE